MAASQFAIFHTFKVRLGNKLLDLDADDIKCALLDSGWTPSLSTNEDWADISANEITDTGYTAGGLSVTNESFTNAAGTVTFDCDDPSWVAGAGGIAARYCVFYDNTDTAKTLICYSLLDTTPADHSAAEGQTFLITLPATGILQLA
jgi:hypothetical protein